MSSGALCSCTSSTAQRGHGPSRRRSCRLLLCLVDVRQRSRADCVPPRAAQEAEGGAGVDQGRGEVSAVVTTCLFRVSLRHNPGLASLMPATASRSPACSTHTAHAPSWAVIENRPVRSSARCRCPERRSDDGQTILECVRTGLKSCPDLELLVELSGLEPLTSCMPSGGSTSTRVHPCRSPSSRVPASPPASG
jgi:hypothetical protein